MPEIFESILVSGGISGEAYDINQGPLQTDIISDLLQDGSPTSPSFLQENTPIHLISTGDLTGPRELDISGAETNGRLFFLSIRNSDIDVYSLTIVSSDVINDNSELEIFFPGDYVFVHVSNGIWRVQNVLDPEEKSNLELEMEFRAAQLSNFKELTYSGNKLTEVNIYEDDTKTVKIFNKILTYTGNNLTKTTLIRIRDAANLVKDFTYQSNKLISVVSTV